MKSSIKQEKGAINKVGGKQKRTIKLKSPGFSIDLGRVDWVIEFRDENDELLGQLKFSKGSLDWRKKDEEKCYQLKWDVLIRYAIEMNKVKKIPRKKDKAVKETVKPSK